MKVVVPPPELLRPVHRLILAVATIAAVTALAGLHVIDGAAAMLIIGPIIAVPFGQSGAQLIKSREIDAPVEPETTLPPAASTPPPGPPPAAPA